MVTVFCRCKHEFRVPAEQQDKEVMCPKCGRSVLVPILNGHEEPTINDCVEGEEDLTVIRVRPPNPAASAEAAAAEQATKDKSGEIHVEIEDTPH